jgi:predicted dehydrogenase
MEVRGIGFIGCGGQAMANLYPHAASIPEMELVACCDLKPELAQRNAERFGAKAWYTDYEEMLSLGEDKEFKKLLSNLLYLEA